MAQEAADLNSDPAEAEWLGDFGARALSEAELDALLASARAAGDATLRRLIKEHQALRRTARELVRQVEDADSFGDVRAGMPMQRLRRLREDR